MKGGAGAATGGAADWDVCKYGKPRPGWAGFIKDGTGMLVGGPETVYGADAGADTGAGAGGVLELC